MIKLLVSVKNAFEASQAIEAGADYIDLKDPEEGALGNLDDAICREVRAIVKTPTVLSATVGDSHESPQVLLREMQNKIATGADIIKLPATSLLLDAQFNEALQNLLKQKRVKLIAVFFADQVQDHVKQNLPNACFIQLEFSRLEVLARIGFYGAMLDIKNKQTHLFDCISHQRIDEFIEECKKHQLEVGLAGALNVNHVDLAIDFSPDYVGFRSGVCAKNIRQNKLMPQLVKEIKNKLYKHNNICVKMC